MIDITQRKRITTATERKSGMLRDLVDEFRLRNMATYQIAHKVGVSASCARRYITDLSNAGVIEIVDLDMSFHCNTGAPIYGLVKDLAKVDKFCESMKAHPGTPLDTPRHKQPSDPTRHLHVMADDENYYIKPPLYKPKHDELFMRFFGRAPCAS